jgi:hypothetical protein
MIENIRFAVPVETQETITKLCQENEELHMWDYANRDNIKRLSEQLENANQKIASLTATLIRHYQEA